MEWRTWCFYWTPLNTWKIVRVYLSDATRAVHPSFCLSLEWDWSPLRLCDITKAVLLLCEPTVLTDMVGSCSALVQRANIHNYRHPPLPTKKKKKSQPRRKVRVLTEPAHPLPLLQTIPTVFVNWCTFLFLNAEQFSEQSLHETTHMRLGMQAKKQNNSQQ